MPMDGANMQNRSIPLAPRLHLDEPAPSHVRREHARDGKRGENCGRVDGYDYKRRAADSSAAGAGRARDAEPHA